MTKARKQLPIGQKFGMVTITGGDERAPNGKLKVRARCDCGTEKLFYSHHLTSGQSRSCGCLAKTSTANRNRSHGRTKTPEYRVWRAMIDRCYYPSSRAYHRYGGRGITMCESWKNSFRAFLEDMGERPSKHHSIDRLDCDGPYEKENCRWATNYQQARNKRKETRSSSGRAGVSRKRGKWSARIGDNYKIHYLGTFDKLSDAIDARERAERTLWRT